jgi:hypothetical protein
LAPVLEQAVPSLLTQAKSQKDTRVIDSLPAPDVQEIRKIRTGDEWHNPYVIVHRDGYELILHDRPRRSVHLSLDDLEQTVLKIALRRWPLGKVVAVQESGLQSPGDNMKIASNPRRSNECSNRTSFGSISGPVRDKSAPLQIGLERRSQAQISPLSSKSNNRVRLASPDGGARLVIELRRATNHR